MALLSRLLAPAVFAAGLGLAALSPMPAQAQGGDDLVRVLVDVADVMFRSGTPYYRHGGYDRDDRLIVVRDRYGRPVYYRQVRRGHDNDRYDRNRYSRGNHSVKCNKHGKCKAKYYDARYDRDRYDRHDRNDRYRWQARRWHDRDRDDDRDDRDWDD